MRGGHDRRNGRGFGLWGTKGQTTRRGADFHGVQEDGHEAKKYFTPFLTLCFIDILCCVVVPIPVFSMLWTAYCIFCEFVSVREKSWQKEELRKAEKTMRVIIDNKDEIAKMAAGLLFQREHDNNTVKKEEK